MRGLGLIFSVFIVFSVVFSATADNCQTSKDCSVTTLTCSHDGQSDRPTDTKNGHHCFHHCTNHSNFLLATVDIRFQFASQAMLFSYLPPITSFLATSLFRPPIV